jgi:hypothetical protein
MKRVLVLALATAGLVLPATANAGGFQGVVIATNAKRKAIVTASANGTVRAVRAPKSFGKIGLGALVAIRARQLPDGTFAAAATQRIRRVKQARVRATVVKRAGQKLYLSAGDSVFVLGIRGSAGAGLRPGDRVTASAKFGKAQLLCTAIKPVGHDDELELEGTFLSTEDGFLSLAVHGRGLVKVAVPGELELPELEPGDEISLHATVEPDGTLTLVSLDDEDADDGPTGGDGEPGGGDGSVDVQGSITEINPTAVTVAVLPPPEATSVKQEQRSLTCVLQGGEDLRAFAIGDAVEIECDYSGTLGHDVLTSLTSDNASLRYGADGLAGWFDLDGVLTSIRGDGLGIQVDGHAAPVNCAMPAGTDLSGFALGDSVELECNYGDGRWQLASLASDSAQLTLA